MWHDYDCAQYTYYHSINHHFGVKYKARWRKSFLLFGGIWVWLKRFLYSYSTCFFSWCQQALKPVSFPGYIFQSFCSSFSCKLIAHFLLCKSLFTLNIFIFLESLYVHMRCWIADFTSTIFVHLLKHALKFSEDLLSGLLTHTHKHRERERFTSRPYLNSWGVVTITNLSSIGSAVEEQSLSNRFEIHLSKTHANCT